MTSNYVILSIKLRLVQYINIYFGKLYRGWEGGGGGRGCSRSQEAKMHGRNRVKFEVVIAM